MKKLAYIFLFAFIAMNQDVLAQNSNANKMSTFLKKEGYTPIALSKLPTGHLCLRATINDSTATLILDTGASTTVLDSRKEQKFILQTLQSENTATGAGGNNIALKVGIAKSLNFEGCSFPNFRLHFMSLDHINSAFRKAGIPEVDGVIGADLLTIGKAIIDYTSLTLYLKE